MARKHTTKGMALSVAALALLAILAAPAAQAGILADFLPEPASPGMAEFIWTGAELYAGPGLYGTGFGVAGPGDGVLPTALQALPGQLVESAFTVPGIPGSEIAIGGQTTFYDATLEIVPVSPATLGFPAMGPAMTFGGQVAQPLGSAIFRLWSTDPFEAVADLENPVLLLEGIAENAIITGLLGSSEGATLSATVAYTGGAIVAATEWVLPVGEFSWSLLDIVPPLSIGGEGTLSAFEANGVGQFSGYDGIPEPATLCIILIGGAVLARRRRRA